MSLHIGVVHWAFPPVIGGVEMHLLSVGPEMVRQGAQVTILCSSVEGEPSTETVEGMTIVRRDEMAPEKLDALREELGDDAAREEIRARSRRMFEEFLDTHQIDVVQAHNLHMDFIALSQALVEACDARNIPAYLVLHNPVFIDRMDEESETEARSPILTDIAWERLVPISDYIHRVLSSAMPEVPDERWAVIKHGIDLETFRPAPPERRHELRARFGFQGRPVILHTGRFLPWKGILPAIKALPHIIKEVPDALMVLPGRAERIYKDADELADYDEQIDRYIKEHDLLDHVYIEQYDREDISRLTALAEVVIYTTIGQEPFGLVPVEGMACGNPVVVTNSGGMVESVIDGETGFIIPRDEDALPKALAERVSQLLRNPELRGRMGARGRRRVEKHFDRRRMARDFIELSRQLVEQAASQGEE
jgi:glycosyltransferase involved in cell wall biosynthesis